jgi:hypothetical protein
LASLWVNCPRHRMCESKYESVAKSPSIPLFQRGKMNCLVLKQVPCKPPFAKGGWGDLGAPALPIGSQRKARGYAGGRFTMVLRSGYW